MKSQNRLVASGMTHGGKYYPLLNTGENFMSEKDSSLLDTPNLINSCHIYMKNGTSAIVSPNDYEWLNQWRWTQNRSGYAVRKIPHSTEEGRHTTLAMHRLIMNAQKGEEVDHINRNRLDNRRENLRIVPHWVNMHNVGKPNVEHRSKNSWMARIVIQGKKIQLGSYSTKEEAIAAYNRAKVVFGLEAQPIPALILPTPKASDGIHPGVKTHKPGQTLHLSARLHQLLNHPGGKLNPEFVEELMGFPPGYTEL